MSKFVVLLIFSSLFVSSCTNKKNVTLSTTATPYYKVGNTYKIKGKLYTPRHQPNYDKLGMASWYGPNFHGKLTANGDIFDQNALTAAHKTLPMPSMVRVTNLENKRQLSVMINDRGPYKDNRIIDLSKKSAELLGFKNQGVVNVRVEFLEEESELLIQKLSKSKKLAIFKEKPQFSSSKINTITNYKNYVQAGVFSSQMNAINAQKLLSSLNTGIVKILSVLINNKTNYKVVVNPYNPNIGIDMILQNVRKAGFKDAIIKNQQSV